MLVLQRLVGESVWITVPGWRPFVVTVVQGQGKIRLGFDAPDAIKIDRMEVAAAKREGPNGLPSEHRRSTFEPIETT